MNVTLAVHILFGLLGLIFGYVALYSTKGASLHRKSGILFGYAMTMVAVLGMVIAAGRGVAPAINIPAGLLTSYLAITALTTVRPPTAGSRLLDAGAMLVAAGVAIASLTFGFQAALNGGIRNGMPAFPFFMFGVVGSLAVFGDIKIIRSGALRGPLRLARHLWRMCFALFIASLSFFIGQAKVFPAPIRIRPLLALPVLLVLGTMFFWLWRVRIRRSLRGVVTVTL